MDINGIWWHQHQPSPNGGIEKSWVALLSSWSIPLQSSSIPSVEHFGEASQVVDIKKTINCARDPGKKSSPWKTYMALFNSKIKLLWSLSIPKQ